MSDEAILNEARELQTRCEGADGDVRRELGLMTTSVSMARMTARTIEETDADAQRHGDGMAQQLAIDLRESAAVAESSGTSEQLAAAGLALVEKDRFSAALPANTPMRTFVVPPPQTDRRVAEEIEKYGSSPRSPFWIVLANPLDLIEELARAAADVAAIAAEISEIPEKNRPVSEPSSGTKETA